MVPEPQDLQTSIEPYNEYNAPTVFGRLKGTSRTVSCGINVPATGSVEFTPEEMREMADEVEENPEAPHVRLLVDQDQVEAYAEGLREAAEWAEEAQEARE